LLQSALDWTELMLLLHQRFTDSDSTDDVESTHTSCKSSCQLSEDDGYNIVHEDQNEQKMLNTLTVN